MSILILFFILILSLILLLTGIIICYKNYFNNREYYYNNETIFVSIASYRDSNCKLTLKQLFDKAANPKRINVGICDQHNSENSDEFCGNLSKYKDQISTIKLDYKNAKGPMYARSLINTLYFNEDYFFMIDSHTEFVKNWDQEYINQIKKLQKNGYKKPILTGYPNDSEAKNENGLPHMCKIIHIDNGFPAMFESIIRDSNKMKQCILLAAGQIFTIGNFVKDIPLYSKLSHIFGGEEILLSYFAYINGYDAFSPNKNLIYHKYITQNRPKVWEDINDSDKTREEDISKKKLYELLFNTVIDGERDQEQFWKLLGWNKNESQMSNEAIKYWCENSLEI